MRKILWKAPSHCRNRDLKKNTEEIYVFPMKRRTIACLLQLCLGTSLLAMTVSAVWQLVCIFLDFQCMEEAWHRLVGRNAFSFYAVDQGTVVCLLFFNLHEHQVLIPAAVFIGLHNDDCCGCFGHKNCGKSCAMLSSVLAACVGILGSGYCIIISALGLSQGPYCFTRVERNWIYPFTESSGGYLLDYDEWAKCQEPQNIVQWNVTLFSILLVLGGIEFILCSIQVVNGILGGVCRLCCGSDEILLLAIILIALECNAFYRCCRSESCNKTYRSFISIVLAMLGVAFSGYSCIIFTLGLIQGPFCNSSSGWDYIFKDTVGGYLTDYSAWSQCAEPANAVEWTIILLSILMTLSGLQLIICFLKVAAELKRTLCGTYSVFIQAGIL